MSGGLIDAIYEAAFVPELWPGTLEEIALLSGSASGEFQLITSDAAPRWQATEVTRPVMADFMSGGKWRECARPGALMALNHAGFLCDHDYMEAAQLETDPAYALLNSIGLGWQLGTLIPMPTGEIVGLTFERWIDNGRPTDREITRLDDLRPHLARAALIAARLQLQRALDTVSALQALGLAAAVTTGKGKVRAANQLFEAMDNVFLPLAFERFAVADPGANKLLGDALVSLSSNSAHGARSIPLAAAPNRSAVVIHVLPLRRAAHDIFSGGDILVVATSLSASMLVPSPTLLAGLFDLTPAEARLASALSRGQSLTEAAAHSNVTVKTGRTYLERIFAKTGTHRQSQLVSLLKSAELVSPMASEE